MLKDLEAIGNAGERMVPDLSEASVFWAHVYRYRFAARFVSGKRVLDIACGEGYGSSGMRKAGARSVIGIDISGDAVNHARERYGVDARVGSAESIPLPDGSVDVIVSFETVEHLQRPTRFAEEAARVLAKGGLLIVSSPNRDGNAPNSENPHHAHEMNVEEFAHLFGARFEQCEAYSQYLRFAAWWSLRGLTSEHSAWHSLPGYSFMLRRLRLLTGCESARIPSAGQRGSADELIPSSGRRTSRALDAFTVRRHRPRVREVPAFMILVARGPKK